MLEYEYSFKVKDVNPFIEFCKKENYMEKSIVSQKRVLYENNSGILARITTNSQGENEKSYLNFKEADDSEKILKVSKESIELEINDSNKEFVKSLLNMFEFKENKELIRKRYIYTKGKVKFEIDEYQKPQMKVVAIEGEKKEVDEVYKKIEELYLKYKLEE